MNRIQTATAIEFSNRNTYTRPPFTDILATLAAKSPDTVCRYERFTSGDGPDVNVTSFLYVPADAAKSAGLIGYPTSSHGEVMFQFNHA